MTQFLWKKSKKADLYIDLTNLPGEVLDTSSSTDAFIDRLFLEAQSPQYQKNNLYAELARDQGRKAFADGNYVLAMHNFNKILTCATIDSDLIAIGYANRSVCFMHLNMIEECLLDIALAKKHKYPIHLMPKLNERLMNCATKLTDVEFREKRFIPRKIFLSFKEHEKFSGVAECLEIRQNSEFGRHVITTRDLNIGATILFEEPFAIFHKRFYKPSNDRCFNCFKSGMNFITCKNCVGGLFCSKICMDKLHNYECNLPFSLSRKETFELVLRMFHHINSAFPDVDFLMKTIDALLKNKEPDGLTSDTQRDFCLIFRLNHNHRKQSKAVLLRFRAAASVAVNVLMRNIDIELKYKTLKHKRFMNHLLVHLLHIAEHSVDLHEFVEIANNQYSHQNYARAMYPVGCYLNHSCVPNVAWYSIDGHLVCKVIRPIKKNEQIFRSYFPSNLAYSNKEAKLKELRDRYHFKCTCLVCSNEKWSHLSSVVNMSNDPLYKEGIKPLTMKPNDMRKWSLAAIEKYEKNAIEFLEKYNRFHPVKDTMDIQEALLRIWNVISTRY